MQNYLYKDLYQLEGEHWWHLAKREIVIKLLKQYVRAKKPRIVDLGCGTGKNLEALSALGSTFGIDSSPRAISFCRKRGISRVSCARAEKTGLPSASVDVVTLLDVLEHTEDHQVLAELARILKDGGLVVITVPSYPWLWSRWDEVLEHKRRYTLAVLSSSLTAVGFRILQSSYLYSFLVMPVSILRLVKSTVFTRAYPSDFRLSSPFMNRLMLKLCQLEQAVRRCVRIPFGTTLIFIAQKP